MDIVLACSLIVASFLCCLFGMIAPKTSVRIGFWVLWIVLFEASHWIESFPDWFYGFLIAATVPAGVIAGFVTRRRVIPPCVRVNDPYRGYRLVFLSVIFIFSGYILFRLSRGVLGNFLAITIPLLLVVFALLFSLRERPEICGNGIWNLGGLHTWDQYESYVWTTSDDGALVELKQREEFREPFDSRLVRLTVPLESSEAAKQLLEANLTDSVRKEAGA